MRHGKKINHLSRTASHRKAMLSNMATSLIQNKRIVTTVAKAKALRKYVEPIITRAKSDSTHARRMVFRYLQNKESVNILFDEVSEKVADRAGGYTRILKTGNRLGDNASMCVMELVDYNEALLKESKPKRAKTRRSRRAKGAGVAATVTAAATTVATEVSETPEQVPGAEVLEGQAAAEEGAEVVKAPAEEDQTEEVTAASTEKKQAEEQAGEDQPQTEEAAEEEKPQAKAPTDEKE
ncbi:MAG: 50S ribosomal protein L17 [Bacteroidetes bacterium]|nr:MAG: 50S ribosomal protein L17 [Bacteroidota bacterium]